MKNKETNPDLKIRLRVPHILLQYFDEAIQGTFPSRNEAIRRGMNLVLEEIKQLNAQTFKTGSAGSGSKHFSENDPAVRSVKAMGN